jgi:formate dehydrogenase iron-sulfur subunit
MPAALLIDTTRCIGCNACAEACKQANNLPGEIDDELTARTWSIVKEKKGTYVRRMCMHCVQPSCASVCPVGALYKSKAGPVAYDEDKCIGCRYCMAACPFQVPKYEWDKALPRVQKCIGCLSRVEAGKQTACAEACPEGATLFGERDALLHEAHARLSAGANKYVDQVYGEREVGGTNVMFLASMPFADLGFPANLPVSAMPNYTWQALSKIPSVVSIGATSLLGIWWIVNRRMRIERLEVEEAKRRREESSRQEPVEARQRAPRREGGRS